MGAGEFMRQGVSARLHDRNRHSAEPEWSISSWMFIRCAAANRFALRCPIRTVSGSREPTPQASSRTNSERHNKAAAISFSPQGTSA
jgi:hypothetical protein